MCACADKARMMYQAPTAQTSTTTSRRKHTSHPPSPTCCSQPNVLAISCYPPPPMCSTFNNTAFVTALAQSFLDVVSLDLNIKFAPANRTLHWRT
ncbi:hypothetical protein FIBSPDRAFT_347087 [Athelia psychrophila]|uniref:Uncharacterized protein n=1 Tax=Athelia psychrophila TaxID=1759441 RepID=A0A166PW60_9AGAM|nr:hypothetical protein FIBSPDRAFT_347087 [Fibularhizoctonia sp. CBS 109695]